MNHRREADLLGAREVPLTAYWGIHTLRATENFPPTGVRVSPALIRAMAQVKKACAITNHDLGYLTDEMLRAIVAACDEVASGGFADQFPVDGLQGGAGTSTNMNVNEVLANRASELLGGARGAEALVHPIRDVNQHQSTNDVYPTALKVAAIDRLRALATQVAALQGALQRKEKEFADVIKMGRTELQEAVPMTLGMEFSAWAEAIGRDRWRTFKCEERLRVVNLGGTAIGTGVTAPTEYIFQVTDRLREVTGMGLSRGDNLVGETANADAFVEVSGILKAHASTLLKLANDLRLLNLLGEIRLPALQAGSSIMPGKVNPVLLEMTAQVAIKVMANDFMLTQATSRSTLQINEFMPLVAHSLLDSLEILIALNERLATHVDGIQADAARCRSYFQGFNLITALVPEIGYPRATALVEEFKSQHEEKDFLNFLRGKLPGDLLEKVLDPARIVMLGHRLKEGV